MGLVFSIYSFASVAASPMLGRLVQLGYVRRVTLLLSGLLVVSRHIQNWWSSSLSAPARYHPQVCTFSE